MQEITFQEFKELKTKQNYIFFFTVENFGCGLCATYETEIKKYQLDNLIKVIAETEDELMEENVAAIPCTRIYNEKNEKVFEKYGILYESQVKEMKGFWK